MSGESPPKAAEAYRQINETINSAIRGDPRIGQLLRSAREAQSLDEFVSCVDTATGFLSKTKAAEVLTPQECHSIALLYATMDFPTAHDGTPQAVTVDLRVTRLPGVDGRPVWLLREPSDVESMRAVLEPGQVWIRADLVKANDWPTVRALASDQVRRVVGKVRPPGRRVGTRSAPRSRLLEYIRAYPDADKNDIHRHGVELGLWDDARGDYVLINQRVGRAKKDSAK